MARASRIGKVDLGPSYLQDAQMVDYSYLTEQVDKTIAENNKRKEEISSDIRTNLSNLQDQLSKNEQLAATNADVVSQRAIQFSESASQKNLQFNRLYQQGKMSRDEFLIATNNVNRSATNLNHFITTIDGYRQQAMERQDKVINQNTGLVEGQKLDAWLSDQYEGYRNLSNHAIYMDDSGQAYFGKIDSKTGGISKNPSDFNSIASTNTQTPQKYLNKDMDKYTTGMTKTLGAFVAANITGFETVEDALEKPGAVKYIEDKWNEFSKNNFNVLSVITNQMGLADNGEEWSFTYDKDEADANSNLILLKKNSNDGQQVGIVSDHKNFTEGKKKAKEKFAIEARAKVARKETPEEIPKKTAQEIKEGVASQQRSFVVSNAQQLMTAQTKADWESAAETLKGIPIPGETGANKSATVDDIRRTDDGVVVTARIITYDDNGKQIGSTTKDFNYNYAGKSPQQFAKGVGSLFTGGRLTQADVSGISTDKFDVAKLGSLDTGSIRTGTGITKDYNELQDVLINQGKIKTKPDNTLAQTSGEVDVEEVEKIVNNIGTNMGAEMKKTNIDFTAPQYITDYKGNEDQNAIKFSYQGTDYVIPFKIDDWFYDEIDPELKGGIAAPAIAYFLRNLYESARVNKPLDIKEFNENGVPLKEDVDVEIETEKSKTVLGTEDIIKKMMERNPAATREQIVKGLIDKGTLPKDYK